ncbi:hypothetical protein EN780_28205 [Mesorhizobium sp. M4B.F.Ca.ET.089.01.1.1]|nr:hypothetical protein EN780_28205 [Mesorhizobium sp. M4B.F.Ca.ET.089.01.1.1]
MAGRPEGGAKDRGPSESLGFKTIRHRSGADSRDAGRDSAPLCPAGHLPHKGGDWRYPRAEQRTRTAEKRTFPCATPPYHRRRPTGAPARRIRPPHRDRPGRPTGRERR